jgi:hypothetical protein
MTNAISGNKRAMENILGLPKGALKSPPGFAKDGKGRRGRIPLPSEEELKMKSFAELMAMLPPKKVKFVSAILKGLPVPEAVAEAGWYAKNRATGHARGGHLLRKDPLIKAAIAAGRGEVAVEVKFGVEAAYKKLEDAIQFAVKTENATALARMIELQAKLFGLLVERQDVRQLSALSINISGID